jgi:hypothetical protein
MYTMNNTAFLQVFLVTAMCHCSVSMALVVWGCVFPVKTVVYKCFDPLIK